MAHNFAVVMTVSKISDDNPELHVLTKGFDTDREAGAYMTMLNDSGCLIRGTTLALYSLVREAKYE